MLNPTASGATAGVFGIRQRPGLQGPQVCRRIDLAAVVARWAAARDLHQAQIHPVTGPRTRYRRLFAVRHLIALVREGHRRPRAWHRLSRPSIDEPAPDRGNSRQRAGPENRRQCLSRPNLPAAANRHQRRHPQRTKPFAPARHLLPHSPKRDIAREDSTPAKPWSGRRRRRRVRAPGCLTLAPGRASLRAPQNARS
jgi:hypothetical protein